MKLRIRIHTEREIARALGDQGIDNLKRAKRLVQANPKLNLQGAMAQIRRDRENRERAWWFEPEKYPYPE